jgi:hypothetical protein
MQSINDVTLKIQNTELKHWVKAALSVRLRLSLRGGAQEDSYQRLMPFCLSRDLDGT